MKKSFRLFSCLGFLSLTLTGCGAGGGSTEPPIEPPTHEHTWADPTYTWSDDYSSCTAERVCSDDTSHKETETVNSVYKVVTPAGCETDGLGRYTATFVNTAFTAQIQDKTIDPINHDWNEPTYEWTSDYSSCTATRVCKNNSTHIESETKNSECNIITPETMEIDGEATYIVNFTNPAFETQTQNGILPKDVYAKKPHLNSDGKTIKYGLYPQTNVNDSALVSTLNALTTPESNGWYLYNNAYYAKASATPDSSSYVFDNGTTIVSGTTYWCKCEPITWNVLSSSDGEYYIVSSVLLDVHCYYNSISPRTIGGKTIYPNNYEYSDIRTWLNNDFYNSAFALGNSYIQTTTVDNSAATTDSTSNILACDNTEDKVFLPSYQDYINSSYGFSTSTSSSSTRYCKTTDWARARGAGYSTSSFYLYNGYYWSRSPRSYDYSGVAWLVYYQGGLYGYGGVRGTNLSVRPGLSIKIA